MVTFWQVWRVLRKVGPCRPRQTGPFLAHLSLVRPDLCPGSDCPSHLESGSQREKGSEARGAWPVATHVPLGQASHICQPWVGGVWAQAGLGWGLPEALSPFSCEGCV